MAAQVLIVDDDAMILRTLADVFRVRQFEVSTAASGEEAIAILAERNFDLVLTDMRMETPLAGYDVVRAAKAHSCKPLVVVLSAYPIPAPEWKRTGADAMFMKGSGVVRMLDEIVEMVSRRLLDRGKPAASSPEDDKKGKRAG